MKGNKLKLITKILAILTICLISFVGIYVKSTNKMQNKVNIQSKWCYRSPKFWGKSHRKYRWIHRQHNRKKFVSKIRKQNKCRIWFNKWKLSKSKESNRNKIKKLRNRRLWTSSKFRRWNNASKNTRR